MGLIIVAREPRKAPLVKLENKLYVLCVNEVLKWVFDYISSKFLLYGGKHGYYTKCS